MELEELESKIPKSAASIEKNLQNCIQRKRIQRFSKQDAKTFLAKAHNHLQTAESLESDHLLDWAIIAYYSEMYMAAKAFTSYFLGQAAKDHGCTIALMLKALRGKKLAKKLGSTRKKFEQEIELLGKVRQFRNSALYSVTTVEEKDVRRIAKNAFEFVEEVDQLLE